MARAASGRALALLAWCAAPAGAAEEPAHARLQASSSGSGLAVAIPTAQPILAPGLIDTLDVWSKQFRSLVEYHGLFGGWYSDTGYGYRDIIRATQEPRALPRCAPFAPMPGSSCLPGMRR